MSTYSEIKRITVPKIRAKKGKEPVVCLTAYTRPMAEVLDAYCDLLLVGDSLGNVIHGYDNTVPVTLDLMILHTLAVMRGSKRACVILDMPFGSYQESPQMAFRNAVRVLKESGCTGVKLEGGVEMAETVSFLVKRGIPVMGHVGMRPQSVNVQGGFAARGRRREQWDDHLADARAIDEAGAFAIVIEGVAEPLAVEMTKAVAVPTIGIGASAQCDGQILVTEDLVGLSDYTPPFVKRYAELRSAIDEAAAAYAEDVKARNFPGPEHCYDMKD